MNISRADTLGSGVGNLYKYTKMYSGETPLLEEGDIFKATIPLSPDDTDMGTEDKILEYIKTTAMQIPQSLLKHWDTRARLLFRENCLPCWKKVLSNPPEQGEIRVIICADN